MSTASRMGRKGLQERLGHSGSSKDAGRGPFCCPFLTLTHTSLVNNHTCWPIPPDYSVASLQILDWLSHQHLQDRTKEAQASPPPTAPYPSPALTDLVLQ